MAEIETILLQLEKDVARLQGLVKHWRVWEAEYELLKEGMIELDNDASETEIRHAAGECEGELLTAPEILALIEDRGHIRKASQVVELLEKRLDYVQQNVKTIERRLHTEQERLDEMNVLGSEKEDGLPLMEITEQLDENDNVISSTVVRPGDVAPELLEMLRQGGIEDAESIKITSDAERPESAQLGKSIGSKTTAETLSSTIPGDFKTVSPRKSPQETTKPLKKKKSVTFAAEPQISHIPRVQEEPLVHRTRFVGHSKLQDPSPITDPIIPEDESAEDMILRQEMLDYNMRDIGNIVAEMDLNGSDQSEVDSEEEYDDEDDAEESEDEFGRTTAQVITAAYRDKMRAMEKRLNAQAIINMGPDLKGPKMEDEESPDVVDHAADSPLEENTVSKSANLPKTKGVRFAEKLDIQEAPTNTKQKTVSSEAAPQTPVATVNPLKDEIVERAPVEAPNSKSGSKKVSRFKAAREVDSQLDTGFPSGTFSLPIEVQDQTRATKEETPPSIHTDIVERSTGMGDNVGEPNQLDPQLHAAEVRTAYHRLRNRLIQREDGFMGQEMEEYEDEHGRQQISRFRAARLARDRADDGREQAMR